MSIRPIDLFAGVPSTATMECSVNTSAYIYLDCGMGTLMRGFGGCSKVKFGLTLSTRAEQFSDSDDYSQMKRILADKDNRSQVKITIRK